MLREINVSIRRSVVRKMTVTLTHSHIHTNTHTRKERDDDFEETQSL